MGKIRYKTIDGEKYHCYGIIHGKGTAKQSAKNLRVTGKKARILPTRTKYKGYYVWRKNKR